MFMRLVKRIAVTCAAVLAGSIIFAATASACTTYTGPSGGNWGMASNWYPATVPTASDDVCINSGGSVLFNGDGGYSATVNSITIASGATLEIEGESNSAGGDYYHFSQLYVNNAVTVSSGGNLLLDSTANSTTSVPAGATSGGTAELFVGFAATSGTSPTLTNEGTITTEQDPGTSYGEYIEGGLDNAGTLDDVSGTLTVNSTHEPTLNSGTWTVNPTAGTTLEGGNGFVNSGQLAGNGAPITLEQNTWTQSGGSVTGSTVSLYNGDTLAYNGGTGSFAMSSGGQTNFLSGTIPAGQTVSLTAGAAGNAIVGLLGAVTNNGTFTMNTPTGSTGNPEVDEGPSGGALVNNATVNFIDPITNQSNLFRANLTNAAAGVLDVQSGTTSFDGGNTMTNQGLIEIAPAAQIIQKGGTTMTNSGTLSPEIASATAFGMYDLYGGTFNAGGALSPILVGGYVPAAGQEFVVLNIGNTDTFSGSFTAAGNNFILDNSHAGVEPGDVGLVYETSPSGTTGTTSSGGSTGSGTPVVPTAVVRITRTSIADGKLTVRLSCQAGHTCPRYTLVATVTEHLKGRKVIALTAIKQTTKVIAIAKVTGTVGGGKTVTVKLSLNKTGVALLKRYGKLRTVVTVTSGGKTVSKKTITLTEPKPVRKTKSVRA
jgi:hypothetical protein